MSETVKMPKLGFDMAEGLLVRWVRQEGESIQKGDVLAEIETDKATVEVESPVVGVVLRHLVEKGSLVPVNDPIAVIGAAGENVEPAPASTPQAAPDQPAFIPPAQPAAQPTEQPAVKASPLARKVARENNLDLSGVEGSGPNGRVVRKDIEALLSAPPPAAVAPPAAASPAPSTPIAASNQGIPTTKLRQAIARRLVESKQTIPHFYVTHQYKLDALLEMRQQVNALLPAGEKLSINDFVLKAAALSLRRFPNLNATLRGAEILQFGNVNIGVAVTVPGGLMTVVVKDADQKSLRQISAEVKAMAARAREGRVKPEDVEGSTFSTSNLGMVDVEEFIAIINPPEAAILAIASAREVPVVEAGQIRIGTRLNATLSVDHRVSDGFEAAQFMQALAEYLEAPLRLLV